MKKIKTNFSKQNPENRYEVVAFEPTIEDFKEYIIKLAKDRNGHYLHLEMFFKKSNNEPLKNLLNDRFRLYDLIKDLYYNKHPNCLFGIKNISTGEIEHRFYEYPYSYHPEMGYVIFQKHSDRDYWGADLTFKLISLKTGEEFFEEFVDDVSGIKDLKFHGVACTSEDTLPMLYTINEKEHRLIESKYCEEDEDGDIVEFMKLPKPNYPQISEYELEFIKNSSFYMKEPSFIEYIENKRQSEETNIRGANNKMA